MADIKNADWCIGSEIDFPEELNCLIGLKVFIWKTHVVNRRIYGLKVIRSFFVQDTSHQRLHDKNASVCIKSILYSDKNRDLDNLLQRFEKNEFNISEQTFLEGFDSANIIETLDDKSFIILLQQVIPKKGSDEHCQQIVIIFHNGAIFIPILSNVNEPNTHHMLPTFPFCLQSINQRLQLQVMDLVSKDLPSYSWLQDFIMPKLLSWSKEDAKNSQHGPASLSLVDIEKYNRKYQYLKDKYGKELCKMWPESTDPQKYVYEDVAIATYIIMLWEKQMEENGLSNKQSFVDLGCGNGLLVYLLSCEGYQGIGVDVRSRKIWDCYEPKPNLQEMTIVPSDKNLFDEYDWLIGNHSDELTPWIPVIAARSSYKMSFFLLPCCSFDFYGKYQRTNTHLSVYRCYLHYIKNIAEVAGFEVFEDRLRIPSTKRVCFVGKRQKYDVNNAKELESRIDNFIEKRSEEVLAISSGSMKREFVPRNKIEITRNCTKTDKNLTKFIVDEVFQKLLLSHNQSSEWNKGGTLSMGEVAKMFKSKLGELKKECGGIQTLLKNHSHIFKVYQGHVRIKKPEIKDNNSFKFHKTKLCWFNFNHPQGCPLTSSQCSFAHDENDIVKIIT